VLAAACTTPTQTSLPRNEQPELLARTNLRAVNGRLLSGANYLSGEVIPMCTPARIVAVHDAGLFVRFGQNEQTHFFALGHSMPQSTRVVLEKAFSVRCADTSSLLPEERELIQRGGLRRGMSKTAVLYSLGFPPSNLTRSLERSVWIYYVDPSSRLRLGFEGDVLMTIREQTVARRTL
jgi:hypothetical protein